jgi:hypothetical protein
MIMDVAARNERAKQYVADKIILVSQLSEHDFKHLRDYEHLNSILIDLIHVEAKGFRGIVATAITGKYLNPTYDPLNNFYSCNPRSIFEHGIFYAFENKVPCGKSDPLNVAKNIDKLDDAWIKGKRPQTAAQAAVDYLRCIELSEGERQEKLINYFFYKLVKYANSVKSIDIITVSEHEFSNQINASKLIEFTTEYPESGAIPQLIVFNLLSKLYTDSSISIHGGYESVFGTNTTSKKPADLWITMGENIINLFEITVKKIDYKRLDDCIASLNTIGLLDKPIQFVCRLPSDIKSLKEVAYNSLIYKGKTFEFIDISNLIRTISCLLTPRQLIETIEKIREFVSQIDRRQKTKHGWNKIFGN